MANFSKTDATESSTSSTRQLLKETLEQNKLLTQQLEEMRAQRASGQLLQERQTAALEEMAANITVFCTDFRACIRTDNYPNSPDPVRTGIRVHNRV